MNSKALKLFALILALAMIFSFAACSGDDDPTTTTSTTAADEQETGASQEPDSTTELTSADITDATAPSEDASAATEASSSDVSDTTVATTAATTAKADGKTTTKADGKTTTKADAKVTTTKAAVKVDLSSKQKILNYYSAATAKAMLPKAGFKKVRYSTLNGTPDVPWVLEKLGATKLVEKFMGIGSENKYEKTIKKGETSNYKIIQKSTLTLADIKDASYKQSGDNYIITIKVKDGSSYADKDKKTNNSPIEKCGICVGNKDKSEYDHKNALVMYDAVDDTLSGAKVSEKSSNVVVTAVINAKTGQLTSLKVTLNVYTDFQALGAQIIVDGKSTIAYSNFKY